MVRPNLARLGDVDEWWQVAHAEVALPPLCAVGTIGVVKVVLTPPVTDSAQRAFLSTAAELLPPEPWDDTTYGVWIGLIKAATGVKGKALFMPLRLALTGRDHGPELKSLLPLIGRERAVARLAGQTA